jgi:ribonuclease HI
MPGRLPQGENKLGDLSLFFDGASGRGQVGAGGFLVLNRSGECLVVGGKFYGPKHTNNVAEARAMVDGLKAVGSMITDTVREVVIKGDSDLVIGFMTRRFKPKKKDLTLLVKEAWGVVRSWKKVRAHFFHIPRDLN